jgi:hypothetical protein
LMNAVLLAVSVSARPATKPVGTALSPLSTIRREGARQAYFCGPESEISRSARNTLL